MPSTVIKSNHCHTGVREKLEKWVREGIRFFSDKDGDVYVLGSFQDVHGIGQYILLRAFQREAGSHTRIVCNTSYANSSPDWFHAFGNRPQQFTPFEGAIEVTP